MAYTRYGIYAVARKNAHFPIGIAELDLFISKLDDMPVKTYSSLAMLDSCGRRYPDRM